MIFAVVPAGGKSTRMGRPKLALPLGDRSVLEHGVVALRQGGVEHVLVVVGPHVPELVPLAERVKAHVLLLPEETPDMRATVQRGLDWLEDHFQPQPNDLWLLVPADHPTLSPTIVRTLVLARQQHNNHSVVVPTFQGRRGHPVVIDWKHVAGMRSLPEGVGLNVYLRQQTRETLEWPVESPTVLCDLDTPEDYERLREEFDSGPGDAGDRMAR
jgi:molybdenum cofactor cytidylyltransferase